MNPNNSIEGDTVVEETSYEIIESDSGDETSEKANIRDNNGKRKNTNKEKEQHSKAQKVQDEDGESYGKERAKCWEHYERIFLEEKDGVKRKYGKCKYCENFIRADPIRNGTTGLNKHLKGCTKHPKNITKSTQTTLTLEKGEKGENGEASVQNWRHDEVRIKKAILNMFVVAKCPFKLVEHEAFVELINSLNEKVTLPSRHTISRDVGKYYVDERKKLLSYLCKPTNTVHLTTDTWTSSCQRVNYMVLTAHFIDDDWVMHKRIINFKPIDSHKGDDIGRALLECLHDWGIKNVMTMTVDNASSNDKALEYLIRKFPNLYNGGKHFHVRCMAHILNLIVKDGLKEQNHHVECVTKAIRYIRLSAQRISKFKKCMRDSGNESKRFLCGDCVTRWNSTHDMLKIAVELREVFTAYEHVDKIYFHDLQKVPEDYDFDVCKELVDFLEKFKNKTETISATSKPLAHKFFGEVSDIDKHFRVWETKPNFCHMGASMRVKYDKYWGEFDKLNDYMYFAVLLDPTMKSSFLAHAFKKMIRYTITEENPMSESYLGHKVLTMVRDIEYRMDALFKTYQARFDDVESNLGSQEACNEVATDDGNDFLGEFLSGEGNNLESYETELKRYLKEPKINLTNGFDILRWWKVNAIRFPIVSRMAKDILAIQISTVASESAFSTSGRVLDPYRSNLSPAIVEALICTQDWVRKSRKPILDEIDDILHDDDIVIAIEDTINNQNARGKGKQAVED